MREPRARNRRRHPGATVLLAMSLLAAGRSMSAEPGAVTPPAAPATAAEQAAEQAAGQAAGQAADTPGAVALRQVAGALLGLESFQADFEQTQVWVGMDAPAVARGTLYLLRPNLFRIEYSEPKGHLQVSDGTRVWTWVPENGEVLLARLADGPGGGSDPLRWVLANGLPEPGVATEPIDGAPARVIALAPGEETGLRRVRLWTRPGSPDLIQYEYEDSAGNRTLYRLTNPKKNRRPDPALFRFTPPAGVPVVELGAP